ncbi:MAG: glycosyltransferase family 9 protein [Chlorobiota bacterium]
MGVGRGVESPPWRHLHEAFWQSRRLGIVRTDHLGDMVLTLPMALAVRELRPETHVIVFAHPRTAPLVDDALGVTAVFVESAAELYQALQNWKPEVLFFPRPLFSEARAAWRAGVPYRVGSGYRWYSWLFTHRMYEHRRTAERHEAEYNVQMVAYAAGKAVSVRLAAPRVEERAFQQVSQLLRRCGLRTREFVVLHPGGRGSAPRWGTSSFAALARQLEEEGVPCIFTGTAAEAGIAQAIQQSYPKARLLFGMLDTREFIALLAQARIVVANSTGALHIAAALGVPVVGLYSLEPPHHPRRWGPYAGHTIVLTPPVEQPPAAVWAIPVEQVYRAVVELWSLSLVSRTAARDDLRVVG